MQFSGSFSNFAFITASILTLRRRGRRSRALARFLWWQIRTGQRGGTIWTLRWVRTMVQSHHSRDPSHLLKVDKWIQKITMSNQQNTNAGWLCQWFRVMNRKHALHCHRCGGRWDYVGDSEEATYEESWRGPGSRSWPDQRSAREKGRGRKARVPSHGTKSQTRTKLRISRNQRRSRL